MTSLIDVWFLGYNSYYVMLRWSPDESFRRISSKIPLLYSMGPKIHQLKHSLLSCLSVLRHFPQGNHRSLITQHKVFRRNATDTASIDRLLSPLRESIIDKPPLASGTLQLPASHLSLFYKIARESLDARFVVSIVPPTLGTLTRYLVGMLISQTPPSASWSNSPRSASPPLSVSTIKMC